MRLCGKPVQLATPMQVASVSAMPVRTIVSRICWCENELIDESWWHSKQNLFVLYHTEVEELRGSLVANTCLYPMHKRYDTCKQGWYEEVWKPKAYVRTMYLVLFHRSASPISWPQITPIERLTHTHLRTLKSFSDRTMALIIDAGATEQKLVFFAVCWKLEQLKR